MSKVNLTSKWRGVVEDFGRSGQTVHAFCKARKLSKSNFYHWRKVLREQAQEKRHFVALNVVDAKHAHQPNGIDINAVNKVKSKPSAAVEVVLANGHRLKLKPGFDVATLQRAVAALTVHAC